MGTFPTPIAASQEFDTYTELQQQIYRRPRLWGRDVISEGPRPSFLTHVKKLTAIIVMLGFVFWLWFGVSTHHAPLASYPYYDTQKACATVERAHGT